MGAVRSNYNSRLVTVSLTDNVDFASIGRF